MFMQFTSCSLYKSVRYRSDELCFYVRIPKDCHYAWKMIGDGEEEVVYLREDSACFYVSSSWCSPNESNIRSLADSIVKLRYQRSDLYLEINNLLGNDEILIRPDTMELCGIDAKGLYWKDILYGYPNSFTRMNSMGISIGYYNVPESDKGLFDKALSTFKNKNRVLTKKDNKSRTKNSSLE